MPDVSSRGDIEGQIAGALAELSAEIVSEILAALGDPPDLSKLTEAMWQDWDGRYRSAITPKLEQAFISGVNAMMEETAIGVDWAQINLRAAEWARNYTYDLVKGIQENSRRALQQHISDFYEQKWTLGQLEEKLASTYGPVRAEMISITETTRAAVEGERAFVAEIERMGAAMVAVWQTSNDERVCPICSPNDGKKQGDGWDNPPPAHPRCRCWLNWQPVTVKQ